MNTAQVLVELLKDYRVEHIFGVPGDTTMSLYDALYAARGEITHIMARDERSASFMADAFACSSLISSHTVRNLFAIKQTAPFLCFKF